MKRHKDLNLENWIEMVDSSPVDGMVIRKAEVLAQLYQARALNEIAQSLDELVRDGIGVKRDD